MDCSTPGLLVHHQFPEFTQIHVHWVSDSFQPSHLLSSPSPLTFNLSQHQGGSFQMSMFFASGGQSIGISGSASVIPMNIQDWFHLGLTGWISLLSKLWCLQHHNLKASTLQCSSFLKVQLSHLYVTTGKTKALSIVKVTVKPVPFSFHLFWNSYDAFFLFNMFVISSEVSDVYLFEVLWASLCTNVFQYFIGRVLKIHFSFWQVPVFMMEMPICTF